MPTEKDRAAERRFYAKLKQDPVRWERYKARRKRYAHRQPEARREYYLRRLVGVLMGAARRRAEKRGLEFSITEEDIAIPAKCPVLGIPLEVGKGTRGATPNSPSLDRVDCRYGYVRGNVMVMSFRANSLKNNATAAELQKVAAWLAENEF